jgi:hypothetical protein
MYRNKYVLLLELIYMIITTRRHALNNLDRVVFLRSILKFLLFTFLQNIYDSKEN